MFPDLLQFITGSWVAAGNHPFRALTRVSQGKIGLRMRRKVRDKPSASVVMAAWLQMAMFLG